MQDGEWSACHFQLKLSYCDREGLARLYLSMALLQQAALRERAKNWSSPWALTGRIPAG
jgi:hypothetical protein